MINVRSGELRQIIDIEAPTENRSSSGAILEAPWLPVFRNVPAKIKPMSGDETWVAAEFLGQAGHIVFLRYMPGLTTVMRINFRTDEQRAAGQDGRLFDIKQVNDVDELHIEYNLLAQESKRGKSM